MIVAITGATGFIGSRLVAEHLRRGDTVRILTRQTTTRSQKNLEVVVGDIGLENLPSDFPGRVDVLYHCAAELHNPINMNLVNIHGTTRLAEAASGKIRHWVQLSSVGVYEIRRIGNITEESELMPVGQYEVSKATSDSIVLNYANKSAFTCTIMRPSNVFGSSMPNKSLFQLALLVKRGYFFYVGPPGASANYIAVENVVDGLLLCGTHPRAVGRTYNLSDWTTFESFIEVIAKAVGAKVPKLRLPLAPVRAIACLTSLFPNSPLTLARINALTNRSRYSIDRIKSELGYEHRISIADGLYRMLNASS